MRKLTTCVVALVALGAMGCGTHDSDADPARAPTAEGELNTSASVKIEGAAAVEIHIKPVIGRFDPIKVTVAAHSKLEKVVKGLTPARAGQLPPRCMPQYEAALTFLDANGEEVASLTSACGFGTLQVKGKSSVRVNTGANYQEIAELRLVPGDALWGIDSAHVKKAGNNHRNVDGDNLKELIAAIDSEQKIDGQRPVARCMPNYSVTFKRNDRDVASASFLCDQTAPRTVVGRFEIIDTDVNGAIELKPRPFVELFQDGLVPEPTDGAG